MTITVRIDAAAEATLRRLVKDRGSSLSAFVRDAIAEKLEREMKKLTPYEPGKHLFQAFVQLIHQEAIERHAAFQQPKESGARQAGAARVTQRNRIEAPWLLFEE